MKNPIEDKSKGKKSTTPLENEDLPGYPHYPADEDILNPSNAFKRVDVDIDNVSRSGMVSPSLHEPGSSLPVENILETDASETEEEDLGIVPGTDADVTKEDLLLLGPKDRDMDMGDDEELENKGFPLGLTGEDLDVPGEELDDTDEEIGEEDEENNYYSLGGDSKDALEEDAS